MLVPALRSGSNLAHLRIHDLDCRPEPFAQSVTMIGCKSRVGAGDQKNAVDAVRQEVTHPFRRRRVVESGDRLRMISPALEIRIEAQPAGTQ